MSALQWTIIGVLAAIAALEIVLILFVIRRQSVDRDECPVEAEWRVESIRQALEDETEPVRLRNGSVL